MSNKRRKIDEKFNNLKSEQAKIIKESEKTKNIQTKKSPTTDIKKINTKEQKKLKKICKS